VERHADDRGGEVSALERIRSTPVQEVLPGGLQTVRADDLAKILAVVDAAKAINTELDVGGYVDPNGPEAVALFAALAAIEIP